MFHFNIFSHLWFSAPPLPPGCPVAASGRTPGTSRPDPAVAPAVGATSGPAGRRMGSDWRPKTLAARPARGGQSFPGCWGDFFKHDDVFTHNIYFLDLTILVIDRPVFLPNRTELFFCRTIVRQTNLKGCPKKLLFQNLMCINREPLQRVGLRRLSFSGL